MGDLYRDLFALKRSNTALWNARWGARMINVPNSADQPVFSFVRRNEWDKVFAVFNFSPSAVSVTFAESLCHGEYTEFRSDETVTIDGDTTQTLAPWSYRILTAR